MVPKVKDKILWNENKIKMSAKEIIFLIEKKKYKNDHKTFEFIWKIKT